MLVKFKSFARRLAVVVGMGLCLHGMADGDARFLVNGTYYGPNVIWTVTLKAGTAGSLFDDTLGPVRTFRYETVVTVDGVEKLVVPGGTWSSNQGDSTYTAKISLRDLGLLTPEACGTHYVVAYTRNYEGNSTVDTGYSMLYIDRYFTISMEDGIQLEASDGTFEDGILVEWTPSRPVVNNTYELYRTSPEDGVCEHVGTFTTTSYFDQDPKLKPDVKYLYKVSARFEDNGTTKEVESNEDEGFYNDRKPELLEVKVAKLWLTGEGPYNVKLKWNNYNDKVYKVEEATFKLEHTKDTGKKYNSTLPNIDSYVSTSGGENIVDLSRGGGMIEAGKHGQYSMDVSWKYSNLKNGTCEDGNKKNGIVVMVYFDKYKREAGNNDISNWFIYWPEDGAIDGRYFKKEVWIKDKPEQRDNVFRFDPHGDIAEKLGGECAYSRNPVEIDSLKWEDSVFGFGWIDKLRGRGYYGEKVSVWRSNPTFQYRLTDMAASCGMKISQAKYPGYSGRDIGAGEASKGLQCAAAVMQHEHKHGELYKQLYDGDDKLVLGWLWDEGKRTSSILNCVDWSEWAKTQSDERYRVLQKYVGRWAIDNDGDGISDEYEKNCGEAFDYLKNPDTFNVKAYHKSYAGYGDNEFLARKAESDANIIIHRENDWAFPGSKIAKEHEGRHLTLRFKGDNGTPIENWSTYKTAVKTQLQNDFDDGTGAVATKSTSLKSAGQLKAAGTDDGDSHSSGPLEEYYTPSEVDPIFGVLEIASVGVGIAEGDSSGAFKTLAFPVSVTNLTDEEQSCIMRGYLFDGKTNIVAWATVTVTAQATDIVTESLVFAGKDVSVHAGHGYFLGKVTLEPFEGNFGAIYDMIDAMVGTDIEYSNSDFKAADIMLHSESIKDEITAEGIKVNVPFDIATSDTLRIVAVLSSTNGQIIASASKFVDGKDPSAELVFKKEDIAYSGFGGPFVVSLVQVLRGSEVVCGGRNVYKTEPYGRDYFLVENPVITINEPSFVRADEHVSDEIAFTFSVTNCTEEAVAYRAKAFLFGTNDTFVCTVTTNVVLESGGNDVRISFDFKGFADSVEGPYWVREIVLDPVGDVGMRDHFYPVPIYFNTSPESLAAAFSDGSVSVAEGETMSVRVKGGSAEVASSVEVHLAYNTAAAADLDLANGTIDGVTPEGGLKFPLTLSWAAGEVGEKVIAIPVRKDAVIEGNECFTLRLENPSGIEMGDASECVVTIVDATIAYTVTFDANEGVVTEASRKVAEGAEIGTLPKPTRDGYSFLGWFTEIDGGTLISASTVVVGDVTFYAHWTDQVLVRFVDAELSVEENGAATVRVIGGNAENASRVDVYLTYNTAAAADVDLAKGNLDGATPKGGLKFPLTLSWAKGEVGEKVIAIPVKADKAVEGDEFFTLQLANAQGVDLGETTVCTVTIKDKTANLTLQEGMLSPTVTATTKGDGNWFVASGSPLDREGLPPLYHVESPALAQGKSSTLALSAVKGMGVLYFSIRFSGDPDEETPSRLDVYEGKKMLGSFSHAEVTNVWTGYTITINSMFGSRAYSFVFTQGSDPNTHAEVSDVVWDSFGNITLTEFYRLYATPDNPAGGTVSGSGWYSYGQVFKLAAKPFPGWKFDGWYEAVEDEETGETGYFLWSKSANVSYKIDRDADVTAVFSKIPYVCALADPADGGKVTGSGLCDNGKKVTLKATANKNFVFVGWSQDPGNGERGTGNGFVSKTPSLVIDRTAKPAKDSATSTTLTDVDSDATFYACFITAEEDKSAIAASVDGCALEPWVSKTETHAFATNVWAGVYLEWPVAAEALSATTVKVAGLPSGLKFAAKPVTSKVGSGKTAVVVTNVPANTIYGAPTAASKTDRNGNVTPSAVKVTVTTAGKSSQAYQIDMVVDALPAWAQGTFVGELGNWERGTGNGGTASAEASASALALADKSADKQGTVSLTIAANGKVSGKAQGDGLAYTLAAPYYSGFEAIPGDEGLVSNFLADVTASWSYKEGSKTVKTNDVVRMAVQDNGIGGYASGADWFAAYTVNWKVEPWKTLGKSFDKKTWTYAILVDGSFSEDESDIDAALGADVVGRVTLKFSANGTVSVAGEFVFGYDEKKAKYTTVKASGSTTLVPVDEEHGVVFVYLTPKGLVPHVRCLDVPWPTP